MRRPSCQKPHDVGRHVTVHQPARSRKGGDRASPAAGLDQSLIDRLTTAAWIFDIDKAQVVWANAAALEVWRAASIRELAERDMKSDMSPAVARRLRQYQEDFERSACVFSELWTIYPGGASRTLRVLFSGIPLADGRMGMFCEARDEVHHQHDTLRSADALLHTQLMISLYSRSGEALYRNPAARSVLDRQDDGLASRFVDEQDYRKIIDQLERVGEVSGVMQMRTSRGVRWHELTARGCHDAVSGDPAILISEADVSELKETEAKARYIALHDTLTGLPNRSYVPITFAQCIGSAEGTRASLGVFFIDLDQFKLINDSLGHAFGDEVLVEVARRLVRIVGSDDSVIRLGGDEFLVIVSGGDPEAYRLKADWMVQALSAPINVGSRQLTVTPSIGISVYPENGTDDATLMKSADLAMYSAKSAGRNCVRFFSPSMRERADSRLELESSLKAAIVNGEFEVYYQPRVSTHNVTIVGAEALLRWNHPRLGVVPPSLFIPVCEEIGLIEKLGEYVLREATAQQKRWSDDGHRLSVSVNVSQRQMNSPAFPDLVADALERSGCDPQMIELELTESMLMEKSEESTALVERFRQHGLRISVDDFGTGYSNLARLHEFAIDCIKIDRAFVKDLPGNKALAEIIIALCKLMHVKIVAEGVETLEQLIWLRSKGCEEFQGFYFSMPITVAMMDALLMQQSDISSSVNF